MAGTKAGALKARETNLKNNPNFYKEIGSKGGRNGGGPENRLGGSRPRGFAAMTPEKRRAAGKKGGLIKGQNYKTKLDTPEQEFKLPAYQTKKKRFALWGR